jgi:hypothetical protein
MVGAFAALSLAFAACLVPGVAGRIDRLGRRDSFRVIATIAIAYSSRSAISGSTLAARRAGR